MESIKNDKLDNKLRWELLPLPLLELVVKVFHFGAEKYGPDRWQNLPDGKIFQMAYVGTRLPC